MTFYLPAHPSYFRERYTQEQIDYAIRTYEKFSGTFSNSDSPFHCRYIFLRQPGKSVLVRFDSAELGRPPRIPEQILVDRVRKILDGELNRIISNLEALMSD